MFRYILKTGYALTSEVLDLAALVDPEDLGPGVFLLDLLGSRLGRFPECVALIFLEVVVFVPIVLDQFDLPLVVFGAEVDQYGPDDPLVLVERLP